MIIMITLKEKVISKLVLSGFLNMAQRQAGARLKYSMGALIERQGSL